MKVTDLMRDEIAGLPVYEPGRPVDLVARENGIDPERVVKLASNENPLGPSPEAVRAIEAGAAGVGAYPDNSGYALIGLLAERWGLGRDRLALGAGSNEFFYQLCDLFAGPGREVVVGEYGFISYRIAALLSGARLVEVPMPDLRHDVEGLLRAVTPETRLLFLPNPNNPTGTRIADEAVEHLVRALPEHVVLCLDEAYVEYEDGPGLDYAALLEERSSLLITRTFSKIHGLAGLRIGYAVGSAELIGLLNRVRAPFNTGNLGQAAAVAALRDEAWVERSRRVNASGREQLRTGLEARGLEVRSEAGNFLLARHAAAADLAARLQEVGVIVRPLGGYRLGEWLRITIGTSAQNARLLEALEEVSGGAGEGVQKVSKL